MGRVRLSLMLILCVLLFGVTGNLSVAQAEGSGNEANAVAVGGHRDDPGDPPDISIDPVSIEAELFTGATLDTAFTVTNNNNAVLNFTIEAEITQEGGRDGFDRGPRDLENANGPRRDNPGDLLGQFVGINQQNWYCSPVGWDWDNERMWVTRYNDGIAAAYTHDAAYDNFEEVIRINCGNNMDGAWADGYLFLPTGLGSAQVNRWNSDGRNIGAINFNFGVYGLAADVEEELLFVLSSNDWLIHVFPLDGEGGIGNEVGVIRNHAQFHANVMIYGMEWVPKHPDGQLWFVNYSDANAYQIAVDTDNWTCTETVQRFRVLPGNDQPYTSAGHDGHNLWVGGYTPANIRVYDDGVTEMYWLMYTPEAGQIAAGGSQGINLTFDGYGLIGGAYRAILHFISDDQAQPNAEIDLVLNVTAAPDIEIEWEEDWGYPQVIDWNLRYQDLFSGGPYTMPIIIRNAGTDDLSINELSAGHEFFSPDADQFVISAGEERVITLTFNAPAEEPGVYEPMLTIRSNDPDEDVIDLNLHAEASLPPVLVLDRNAYQTNLLTGDVDDVVLNIANDGDALLRWDSEIEVMQEGGGRDNSGRSVRSLVGNPVGPRRDEVNLNGMMFAVFQAQNIWGWLYEGMAQDELLDENNFVWYQDGADWDNVNFSDYNAICIGAYQQPWNQQYQNNLARLEEYVADGGALYYETANSNAEIRSPGGIYNNEERGSNNGVLVVSPDPAAENYSLFAEICHESQPNNWNEGEVIEGSSWLHAGYNEQQFIDGVNDGTLEWYQVIANGQDNNAPGAVAYGFGAGTVLTVAHPVGHTWFNFNQEGQWGSIAAEILFYLTEASGVKWVTIDPTEGELQSGADQNINVHFDSYGLVTGSYVADIHILSNDPADPDQVFTVTLDVTGDPDTELEWAEEDGFPNVLDWNMHYVDLFTNGPYTMQVTMTNVGGDDMNVSEAYADHEYFTVDPEACVIAIGERQIFTVTFNAPMDQPDEYETDMHIITNDHDEAESVVHLHANASLPPIIVLNHMEYETDLLTGETEDWVLNIANEGTALLRWESELVTTQEPGVGRDADSRSIRSLDGSVGPRRDEAGEVLAEYSIEYPSTVGLAWDPDNELLWGYCNNPAGTIFAFDPAQEQIVNTFGATEKMCCLTYLEGRLYMNGSSWNPTIAIYDLEGNEIERINTPFGLWNGHRHFTISVDGDDSYFFIRGTDGAEGSDAVYVYSWPDFQDVAHINDAAVTGDQSTCEILWTPNIRDGQLWVDGRESIYQLGVDAEWNCELLQTFDVQSTVERAGLGYDGKNIWRAVRMWQGGGQMDDHTMLQCIDNGVRESNWLWIEPDMGELQSGSDQDVILHFDATGLLGGAFVGDLHFYSNDPATPDVVFVATLNVTGAPDIDVTWDDAAGYPNEINWNGIYADELYAGGPYTIEVTVANIGTDDLEINDVYCDIGEFTTNWDPDMQRVLGPEEETAIIVTLETAQPANLDGTLTLVCNDNDEQNVNIRLLGVATNPPILTLSFNEVVDDMVTGDVITHDLEIGNDGEANLRFVTDLIIIQEPGERDADSRSIRSLNGSVGPNRDEPGELLGQFQGINQQNIYCSPVGWDWDNERMWVAQYNNAIAAAYTHDNGYQNFEEVLRINCGNNMDGCWVDGYLFLPTSLGAAQVNRWNSDGENIGAINFGFGVYGLAADIENEWLFVLSSNDWGIHVFPLDGEGNIGNQIGVIAQNDHQRFHGNQIEYGFEWVAMHPDGQLWFVNYTNGLIYQIAVDTDQWTCIEEVQNFRVLPGQDQPYTSSAHDGYNMWVGGYAVATIRVYDDGVTEAYWLIMEPEEGEIQPGSSIMGAVTLDAAGLIGGEYIAEIVFISNDPVAPLEQPDATISVTINVTGVPNLDVTPGGPEEEEPPVEFGIVYFNYPESMMVEVENVGTEDLELTDVVSDQNNPDFYVNGDDLQGFVLAVGEARALTIWYNPDQQRGEGEQTATLMFTSNDPRYPDGYPVRVVATALVPPILTLEFNAIDRELNEGDVEEITVDLGNDGGSQLDWEADIDVIVEPGRDVDVRSIRSLDRTPVGPRRDEVDLGGMRFAWFQAQNVWGWLYDGMLRDELLDDDNCDWYQNAADWDNVDFEEYDVICIAAYNQPWNQQYANNLERLEEYCDGGGGLYYETANVNAAVRSPGGIYNDNNSSSGNGVLVVSPDPAAENYSLFAEICHESQPNFWEEGEVIEGSSWLHAGYNLQQFDNGVEEGTLDWYQVIAVQQQNQGVPGAVAYGFGSGVVLTVAHPVGHCWVNYNQEGMWGSIAAEILFYLTEAGGAKWILLDPMEGSLAAGSSQNLTVTLNTIEVLGGRYAADIHFTSNDPANPDVVLAVTLTITGQSVFGSEPAAAPFSEAPNIEFPIAYQGFESYFQVNFTNVGSGIYAVNGFEVEGANPEDFGIVMDAPFEINASSDSLVTFYFRPGATGERNARLHLITDAMNVVDQDVYWDLSGMGMLPPSIYTRPENGIPRVYARSGGNPELASLVIGNAEGQDRDTLTFAVTSVELEQGRDANSRSIRSLTNKATGPRRDEPGDVLQTVDLAYTGPMGISRDPETNVMWVDHYTAGRVVGYQWDGEQITGQVADFGVAGGSNVGGTVWNGVYYGAQFQGTLIYMYDLEGNQIATMNMPDIPISFCVDGERGYLFYCTYPGFYLRVLDINNDFEEVAVIRNMLGHGDDANARARMAWVPEHRDGHLWMTYEFNAYQVNITDDWQWEEVQRWRFQSDRNAPGIANDGENMWIGNIAESVVRIHDDGASEGLPWLTMEPEKGSILAGEETEIAITCSPTDLADGVYEGNLVVKSNDPANPEIYLGISMDVGAGPQMMHFATFDADNFPNGWHVTASDHSVLVNNVLWDDNVAPARWEIGVFTPGGVLSGGSIWTGGDPVGVAVYGAEGDIAQFQGGETMMFKVWDNEADVEHEMSAEVAEGTVEWSSGGFTALSLVGRSSYTCVVPFAAGWNLISINVTPPEELWNANGPDVRLMMAPLRVDANRHHVILMKNERGNFYAPANNNFNNIPFWNTAEGYQVRMDAAVEGTWTGVQIDAQADVPIAAGWNMIAYFPTYQLTCARNTFTAISPIVDNVILTKDGFGHFASPRNNFSNMDPWREGRGYQVNVNANVVLNYPAAQQGAAAIKVGESDASVVGRWAEPAMTGANMSVLVTGISGVELAVADQVAAFNVSGRLVGVGRVTEGMIGLAVWGDDKSTELVDGLVEGEAFTLKLWDADKDAVVDLRMEGLVYATDGFTASDAVASAIIPDNYSLGQNFPNPFNAVTRIAFGLPEASRVSIRVFDVAGREVATLVSGNLEAGNHTAVWSAEGFNSGVYLVKMETPSFSDVRKVTLIK